MQNTKFTDPEFWCVLAERGGGPVPGGDGTVYDTKTCYIKAIEVAPGNDWASAWNGLGELGGGTVNDTLFDKKGCFVKAAEGDGNSPMAWYNLGVEGGGALWTFKGTVEGAVYDSKTCYTKAIELYPMYAAAYKALGTLGGGPYMLNGESMTAEQCLEASTRCL